MTPDHLRHLRKGGRTACQDDRGCDRRDIPIAPGEDETCVSACRHSR